MQANGPSPHAVSVRPSAASRAFDLWLHVSIEVISIHYFHNVMFPHVFVQFGDRGFSEFVIGIL